MSIQLISLSELKSFIGKNDTTDDQLLDNLISYVSKEIETYLQRDLNQEYRTKYFNAGGTRYCLSAYPIVASAVITVTIDGTAQTEGTDFFVWDDEGVIEFGSQTTYNEPKDLIVTWLGGYDSTSGVLNIPDDMKYACVMQCAFAYKRRKDIGLSSISLPDGSLSTAYPADLLPEVKKIINRYKNWRVSND